MTLSDSLRSIQQRLLNSDSAGNRDEFPLCSQCSGLNLDEFSSTTALASNDSLPTRMLISLFTVIKNFQGASCKFCSLLFDTLALKRHDPFEHPAIKDCMPEDMKGKTFESWARRIEWYDRFLKSTHPFGSSRNKILIEEDPERPEELRERRNESLETLKGRAVFAGGTAVGATTASAIRETDNGRRAGLLVASGAGTLAAMFQAEDNKLPVVLWVRLHRAGTADAGLIEARLWGYGRKVNAPLARLSSFNLRISSGDLNKDGKGGFVYGRTVGQLVDVKNSCSEWLQNCLGHHSLCREPQWSTNLEPPSGEHFRLIEIGNPIIGNGAPETRAQNEHGERIHNEYACKIVSLETVPKYAALSYVWGDTGATSLNLHMGNLARLSNRINGQERKVAQTISDAIIVAKDLGFQYLWVDSLCVIQQNGNDTEDPRSREARESQLKQMDRIFAHADVVLVAAAGLNADAGLVGVSKTRKPDQTVREVRKKVNVLLPLDYDKSYGKWDTRGWTLQEMLLSKRLLVFGERYVSFHCRHSIQREDVSAAHAGESAGPPPIPYLSGPPAIPDSPESATWNGNPILLRSPYFTEYAKLIEQYTSREMSRSCDILFGISGLLNVLEGMRGRGKQGHHTLYGLPEEFLDLALLWQPPAVNNTHLVEREDAGFPSWSWAGWKVIKNPRTSCDNQPCEALPGVRFEEPFWVASNDDLSIRKFKAEGVEAEERFKPLVMWFKFVQERPVLPPRLGQSASRPLIEARSHSWGRLVPVNGCALGVVFDSEYAHLRALEKVLNFRGLRLHEDDFQAAEAPYVEPHIPLSDRHLVCETQKARFKLQHKHLRTEPVWHLSDGVARIERELQICELEILDRHDNVVGHVIPTDQSKTVSTGLYDFIVLSESQYWGNEKRVDVVGYPLYNVMLIEWDTRGWFATRTGLGKISKQAWRKAEPSRGRVILK